jgi:hypothetical protein
MELGRMAYQWPKDTDFSPWELDVLDRNCPVCGRMMHICDHRYRRFHTLDGPVQLICKLNHCPDPACPGHARTKSPELEIALALPQVAIGWDDFCWFGHRSHSRHIAISLIQSELLDDYGIKPSEDAIDEYTRRYQAMLAARQQDPDSLRRHYGSRAEIILCIDGLQPEKGLEGLYVVRELTRERVWFAVPLLSATEAEVRLLIQKAKEWAQSLGTPVGFWVSDKQDEFVKAIAAEFPEMPHRYCDGHYLREAARLISEADRHARQELKKRVRGIRPIERRAEKEAESDPDAEASEIVRYSCAAVLAALSDDGMPPLAASELKLQDRPSVIAAILDRVAARAGTLPGGLKHLQQLLRRGLEETAALFPPVREAYKWVKRVARILKNPGQLPAPKIWRRLVQLLVRMRRAAATACEPSV